MTRGQQNLISYPKDAQVDAAKKVLISHAQNKQRILLGTIYKQEEQLVLDIVVPMYAVQSVGENVIEGFMLVTLPMQNVLADILAPRHLPDPNFVPLVLTKFPDGYTVASMQDEKITLTPSEVQLNDKKVPFAKRISCRNINQAEYSQGGHVHNTGWYVLLEQDAALVEAKIAAKARNIYALGVFGTLFIALILAIIVGSWIARTRAREGQKCISGLVHAIECALDGADAKFKYLQGRSQKVARFSGRLGRIMKLSGEALENIQLAARLSQVGKIFVPREIMVKRGLLTEDERRQVQLAPYHAYNVLKGVLPRRVARIVYQMGGKVVDDPVTGANHELTTKEMLLEARVLLVANDFCAMVSQRGTRPPLPMAEARKKLEQRALYDRDVIAAVNTLSDAQLAEILELDLNPSNSAS
ncbi:MAG: hypothetical protein IJU79_02475 [Desulfovibrionaceae bacterium]|nr:hypothetical protein [Desulfovibrionaceae bacterium]